MDLISLLILIYAIKSAIEDTRSGWRTSKAAYMRSADTRFPDAPKSRRAARAIQHDTGYWAAQVLRGFPGARHGFGVGWREGRQAQAEGKPAPVRLWRRRPPVNDTGGTCLYCDAGDGIECQPDCPYLNMNWREVDRIKRERAERAGREGTGEGSQPTRRADGKPETEADRRFFDLRTSGYTGPIDRDGNIPGPDEGFPREGDLEDPSRPTYSYGPVTSVYGWPAGNDADKAHRQAQRMSTGKPWVVTEYPPGGGPGKTIATYLNGREVPADTSAGPRAPRVCVACGNPEGGKWGPLVIYDEPLYAGETSRPRLIHKAHFEDESTGFYGEPYKPAPATPSEPAQCGTDDASRHRHCNAPGCPCPCHATAETPAVIAGQVLETEPESPAITEGNPSMAVAADTTYDGVLAGMTAAKADAEVKAAEQQQASRQASSMSEQMQALEVDPGTLSAMADHLDAHDAATKAQQRVQETAEAVEAAMKRGHAGLSEAHKDAPVEAARKEFYAS